MTYIFNTTIVLTTQAEIMELLMEGRTPDELAECVGRDRVEAAMEELERRI